MELEHQNVEVSCLGLDWLLGIEFWVLLCFGSMVLSARSKFAWEILCIWKQLVGNLLKLSHVHAKVSCSSV